MPNPFRRPVSAGASLLVPALLMCLMVSLSASPAVGQDSTPPTRLQKHFNRIDFSISALGEIGSTVSGIEQRDATTTHSLLTIKPSGTVGELVTLRYTVKPYVGFEFNFGNLRYSQDFTFVPPPQQNLFLRGAQSGVREMTLGYVAHLPYRPLGVTPFLGIGGGTVKFTPTAGGGQHLPFQYRAAYYYSAGFEGNFPNSPFGMRIGFRQLIYLAPDFEQNYLTITRRVITSEPNIGFFVHF